MGLFLFSMASGRSGSAGEDGHRARSRAQLRTRLCNGMKSRWTQQSCLELSVLPANPCLGRKAGRHAASGMGAWGGRQGGCWDPAGLVTFCPVPVILG